MTVCPHCQRRLLSQASARCSWCGIVIDDRDYQVHASVEREAYFAHLAQQDAKTLANTYAINGTLYDMERGHVHTSRENVELTGSDGDRPQSPPETDTQGRFRHLEW